MGPGPSSRLQILGSRVDFITLDQALEAIDRYVQSGRPHHIITGNTLMMLEAQKDPELRRILEKASLVVPESSGVLWACRVMGVPLEDFTPGIDLLLAICRIAQQRGYPVYLLGSSQDVVHGAGEELLRLYPGLNMAGTHHGFFSEEEVPSLLEALHQARPALLFVGMGMPLQEKWIARHLTSLGVPVVMGVGGSFDVLSGKLWRAPSVVRRAGMEWLFRLAQEPWRWRRIARLPVFAWKVIRERQRPHISFHPQG